MSRLALITFLGGGGGDVDPGFGVTPPVYPSHGLPGSPGHPSTGPIYGGGYPSQGLPGGGHISLLPVFPFDPTLSPDQGLPADQPEAGHELPRPGKRYVVKWLACHGLILVPDQGLPETPQPK